MNSKADCTDEWVVLVKSMGKSTFSSVQSAWLYNELIYNATRHYYRNLCIKNRTIPYLYMYSNPSMAFPRLPGQKLLGGTRPDIFPKDHNFFALWYW